MEKYTRLSKNQMTSLALTMIMAGGGAYGVMSAVTKVSAQTPSTQSSPKADQEDNETLGGSIQVGAEVEDESLTEAEELTQYTGLATITADEAKVYAESEVGGTATKATLGNENGSLIYEVQIGTTEVKVDAGNGTILATEDKQ